ncbi:MAG: hypothetical protein WAU33_03260 [Candidatus Binataceae bacterium]
MPIDFTMPSHLIELRNKIRAFIKEEIEPACACAWAAGIGDS